MSKLELLAKIELLNKYEAMMEELVEIKAEVKPIEILLTIDAMAGQDAVNVATTFNEKLDITGVIVTDIARDGVMGGSNCELYRKMREEFPALQVTASGGVSSHGDLQALRGAGCWGAIVGKAYYTGAVDLREALEACK